MNEPSFFIHETAVIGFEPRFLQGAVPWRLTDETRIIIPKALYIGPYALVGMGAKLGERVVIDAYCKVDPLAELEDDSLLIYRGTIGVGAKVGKGCVIGGSVSEGTTIEDRCRSFGRLIHTHDDSTQPWDFRDDDEASPIIRHDSFIGHDALIIGGIEIGPCAYVCAGATVSHSVPPKHIAYGINKMVNYSAWKGKLKDNPLFQMGL